MHNDLIAEIAYHLTADPDLITEWGKWAPSDQWINPDKLLAVDAIPIIYTSDGKIYYGEQDDIHGYLVANTELYQRYLSLFGHEFERSFEAAQFSGHPIGESELPNAEIPLTIKAPTRQDEVSPTIKAPTRPDGCQYCGGRIDDRDGVCDDCGRPQNGWSYSADFNTWRELAQSVDLYARTDANRTIVSFWNTDPQLYQKLLSPCIKKMMDDGVLQDNGKSRLNTPILISTPLHKTVELKQALAQEVAAPDEETLAKAQLWQRLHTMPPDEKRAAMQRLGLTGEEPSSKRPWQQAFERERLIQPGQKWWAPYSEEKSTDELLSEWKPISCALIKKSEPRMSMVVQAALERLRTEWLDPDSFFSDFSPEARAFIYRDGKLYVGRNSSEYHGLIARRNVDLHRFTEQSSDPYDIRDALVEYGFLVGRTGLHDLDTTGSAIAVVSFWNKDASDYDQLEECLIALREQYVIPEGTKGLPIFISTPIHRTTPIDDISQTFEPDLDEIQLRKQLHTMNVQKKEALRKLGVHGSKPHPIQQAMSSAGLLQPGQKWWALASEEINARQLNEWGEQASLLWIHPDKIFNTDADAIPFVYYPDGTIYYGDIGNTHFDLKQRYSLREKDQMYRGGAEGRIGEFEGIPLVSFWNQDNLVSQGTRHALPVQLLQQAIEKLLADGRINADMFISTPQFGTIPLSKLDALPQQTDEYDQEQAKQARELHLLRGQDKRRALERIGAQPSKKNPWQQEAERLRVTTPGHKLWAIHSESR